MSVKTAVGWDIHRKFSQLTVVAQSEQGEIRVVKRMRLEHADRAAMREELAKLPPATPIAMEGAFGWPWIADLLDELGLDPHLGHPPAIRVLAKNEAKADRMDADRLGRFWLRGIFPKSYLSTPEVRQLRERMRYRIYVRVQVNGWLKMGSRAGIAGRRGRRLLGPHDQEVDRFVTLKHLFGIVPGDVAMKGNTTSATIHGVDGRKQVRRQRYRRGRWMVVTHGNRRKDFVFR